MGNEALRSSRHSASSSSFRRSTRRGSKSGQNYIAEDEVDSGARNAAATGMEIVAQTAAAKPTRRLDKIRRSLSFRRKKKSKTPNSGSDGQPGANMTTSVSAPLTIHAAAAATPAILPASASVSVETTSGTVALAKPVKSASTSHVASTSAATETAASSGSKPALWIEDEKRVRSNNCSFQVKYLGSIEVADSRGMHICELAIEKLLLEKKKPIKAILYVSGDSLRVVDELNKTLLVDQTIEKVSFCAPDRHHENGFAYICRDGTTRRWLCHGFMAAKETLKGTGTGSSGGERLSHAVGCAFSVCLEKKQKRERENVSMEVGPNHSFTRLGSFRQASLTERLEDPQIVMPSVAPVPVKPVENPHAIERPRPNLDTFNRQNPLRATGALQMPFKRNAAAYSSLKPGELPSFQQQKISSGFGAANNSSTGTKTSLILSQQQQQQQQQATSPVATNPAFNRSDTSNKINTISELPEEQFEQSNNSTSNVASVSPAAAVTVSTPSVAAIESTNKLAEQLSAQLSIQQPLQPQPALTPVSIPPLAPAVSPSILATAVQAPVLSSDPAVLQQQILVQQQQLAQLAQLYQQSIQPAAAAASSSVFATPQSLPPTPSVDLLHSAAHHQSLLASGSATPFGPGAAGYYNASPMVQMMPVQYVNGLTQQPAMAMVPVMPTPTYGSTAVAGAGASPATPAVNETFEQKWARIQAAKKTNPFAEDIAKKFEIKL